MKIFIKLFFSACLLLALSLPSFGQRSTRPSDKVAQLTQEEASECWSEFLRSTTAPFYTFKMELEHRPRRGESVYYDAMMFGRTRGPDFAVRINISQRGEENGKTSFLILSEGGKNRIYRHSEGKTSQLDESQWQSPLMSDLIYTPFDVLMPYKRWVWNYGGSGRVGRALHFFDLTAPAAFAVKAPDFARVRVGLSREFNAPYQTEYFNAGGELLRTMSLSSVKKFQENWISKQIEMHASKTRDRDRISITHGSFENLPAEIFEVKNLDKPVRAPTLEGL